MDNSGELRTKYESRPAANEAGSASALNTAADLLAEEAAAAEACAQDAVAAPDTELYRLTYEQDGVYFETTGNWIDEDSAADIISHIKRKNLQQPNMGEVGRALKESPCRVCIAPAQTESFYNETAVIAISADQMEASITLLPPDKGGARLTYQQLVTEAASRGVTYGIDENVLKDVYENKLYGRGVCFAKGTAPEDGTDGALVFHFNTEELLGTPVIDEKTGKVDYKNLNLFVQVAKGQLLVSRTPATPGSPGFTVTGRTIHPKSGREAKMPAGKNVTYDEERYNMYAGVTGRVDYKNLTVSVSSCYTIPEDVDLSIGNITFDGDVLVKGNVISDITIQATRNIEIDGVAESATLLAGGNIILKNGMRGNDKGVIEAEGSVTAKYIERSKVKAGGDINVDALIHCRAECGGSIVVKGKHGVYRRVDQGGQQYHGAVLGSSSTLEEYQGGLPPSKRERLKFSSRRRSGCRLSSISLKISLRICLTWKTYRRKKNR